MLSRTDTICLSIVADPRPHPVKMAAFDAVWCNAYNRLFGRLPQRERRLLEFGSETLPVTSRPMPYRARVAEIRRRLESGEIALERADHRPYMVRYTPGTIVRAAQQRILHRRAHRDHRSSAAMGGK
jgi:hypothetical protein